ncbi:MAG: bifunctional oligoribonuclease/PAP phosphatase NrnA [Crocinitomicaceae bacterium]
MFDSSHIETIKTWFNTEKKIVITSHKSPDGDSIGSSIALMHFLIKIGQTPTICHPDKMPDFYEWLEGSETILNYDNDSEQIEDLMNKADIIFCLDYNHSSRIGDMQTALEYSNAKKVMIDHHQNPDSSFFDILFSFPAISSTCELIYEFILEFGDEKIINPEIGEAIYCGIMTDTGSFRFPSTTSRTHSIIAKLIDFGVKNHSIHEQVYDVNTISKIKLNGFAMSEKLVVLDNLNVAYISLSKSELKAYNSGKGDTEGLVNKALSIKGIKMAIFLKEDSHYIKMSFRSKGDTYVNELASDYFEGGGHKYAAGGKSDDNMEKTIEKLVTLLPLYVKP